MSKKREIKVASDGGRLISPPPLSKEHQRHQGAVQRAPAAGWLLSLDGVSVRNARHG